MARSARAAIRALHRGPKCDALPTRCYTELAETTVKMARFLTNRDSLETLAQAFHAHKVLAGGTANPTPTLQKPPFELPPASIENA